MSSASTNSALTGEVSAAEAEIWHGYMLKDSGLPLPRCAVKSDALARPDQKVQISASEYLDDPATLSAKADVFIEMMRKSQCGAIISGAGLSVSSGIADYASNASGSLVQAPKQRLTVAFTRSLRPTPAHRVIAALVESGTWKCRQMIQQNHDGLEHLASKPAVRDVMFLNEIHGSWYNDKENPVVPMSGNLRSDLFEKVMEAEKVTDMCLSIGSSHSGLNVDRVPRSVGLRHKKHGKGAGLALCSLQRTQIDDVVGLRIFAKCDDFMMLVANKLGLRIDFDTDYDFFTAEPKKYPASANKFPQFAQPQLAQSNSAAAAAAASSSSSNASAAATASAASTASAAAATTSAPRSIIAAASDAAATSAGDDSRVSITVGNRHALAKGDGESDSNSHQWTMYVRASRPGAIRSVTYELHPTFKPSSVEVSAAQANNRYPGAEEFVLSRLGWGTFPVGVAITLANGKTLKASHNLRFDTDDAGEVKFVQ